MNISRSWVIGVIALDMVIVVFIGGYFLLKTQVGSTTQPISTTTAAIEAASTTATSPQSSGPTWELPSFDGSVLLTGSVGTQIRTSDASWGAYDSDFSYLAIDGTPAYDLGNSTCLDDACESQLNQLVDGARFVWVTESPVGFSDELSHAIAPSGESLAACWSQEYEGPVVVILGADGAVVDRAWVLTDLEGTTTWVGLDPFLIDRTDVLPLPFAGYDLPTC